MEIEKQETELNLSKSQLQNIINSHIQEEHGLNELFAMRVNGLMLSERSTFLNTEHTEPNKGNGYRYASRSEIGSKLQLKIPRDRLGVFQPIILGLLNEQEEQVKDLCFELYGKGLTTRQIEDVVANIYGSSYSKSTTITVFFKQFISNNSARSLMKLFLVIFGIVHVATTVFHFGIHSDNPASSGIKGLYIIALSTISIGYLFNEYNQWYRKGSFAILVGWLSFYIFNIGFLTMSYWLIESNSKFTTPLHQFLTYSFYVMSLLFTIGFYLIAKERRELSL